MKERNLTVTIIEFVDNEQPGWVKCCFLDVNNKTHYITEKVPVVTTLWLDERSEYPQIGYVRCQVIEINTNQITIDINEPFGISDENGQTIFKVFSNQLI